MTVRQGEGFLYPPSRGGGSSPPGQFLMNPQRLQTRTQLLEYIKDHAPSSAVRRAVDEGQVNVLGAFASLYPHTSPGFIVEVTSRHGRTWPVGVVVEQVYHSYRVVILDQIPWSHWDGSPDRGHPVIDGDNPLRSEQKRLRHGD